ncbi:MAG: cellulase family glycosylhydrolase, partial [Puniceicoccales bacterium]
PTGAGEDWPANWPQPDGASWESEGGNHFIRMESPEPGKMVMLYREIAIPEGTEALEFSWKQRVTGLQRGEKSWFDARIMMDLLNADREKVGKGPTPSRNRDTDGWEERTVKFNLPEGARIIKFMPSLFQVKAGTLDLDDVVFTAIPALSKEEDPAYRKKLAKMEEAQARQRKAQKVLDEHGTLIPNGDLQADKNSDGRPDHWGRTKEGISYEDEGGSRFLRLQSDSAETMVMIYRKIDIPEGAGALELSWDWRLSDLKTGSEPWHDARIMIKFLDVNGKKLRGGGDTYAKKSTDGWKHRSRSLLVPEGAVAIEIMPTLFNVKSGVMDLDNIKLVPVDAGPLLAAEEAKKAEKARLYAEPESAQKENWPLPIHVDGNRLKNSAGEGVWLQGVNVASMEWNPAGENVLKSTQVAIDEWGANCIRLPVKEEYWFGKHGDAYKKRINDVVIMAANRGAYVILDLHRYRSPKQEHIDFWVDAAAVYKNHPAVLFDILNEPHSTSWDVWRNGGFVETKKKKADEDAFLSEEEKRKNAEGFESVGMQALVEAVRSTGASNVIVAGGLDWAYDLSGILEGYALDDPGGNGIMYASHVYPWKSGWQKKFLDVAEKYPILLGEVGADENKMTFMPEEIQEDWQTWVPSILGLIQEYQLNWTAWCFHPKASPRMLLDWNYTPTPFWGVQVKEAFGGKEFELDRIR